MVRLATLAVLFLSASAIARPTHRRRHVCKTSAAPAATESPEANDDNYVIPDPEPTKMVKVTKKPQATQKPSSDDSSSKDDTKDSSKDDNSSSGDDSTSDDSGSSSTDDNGDGGIPSGGSSVSALFPMGAKSGWAVAASAPGAASEVPDFTANTFVRTKEASTSKPTFETFQGKKTMKANIPKGCLTPGTQPACGFSFYSPGVKGSANVDLTKAKHFTFSYSAFFSAGYDFGLGGKLPGPYGGVNEAVAATCSGGRHNPGCWSARLMFRPGGAGESYLYLPQGVNSNNSKCGKAAKSKCEGDYGASAGRGTWNWKTGQWTTVSQRIKLNTPGKDDGETEVFVGGKSVLKVGNITWRTSASAVARGIQMQIFHGGHEDNWRASKNQSVHFADFAVGIIE